MYLLTFEAIPTQAHKEFETIGGAFINVWIPSDHADEQLCEGISEQLAVLKLSWGKWQWSEKSQSPTFEDSTYIEAYNKALEKIHLAGDEASKAHKKLIGVK